MTTCIQSTAITPRSAINELAGLGFRHVHFNGEFLIDTETDEKVAAADRLGNILLEDCLSYAGVL